MDAAREDGQSIHIRLSPSPPITIRTNRFVNDRLEISSAFTEHGLYRRLSGTLIRTLEQERDRQAFPSDKRDRLNAILALAYRTPDVPETDLGNPPVPDVDWACNFT